MLTSTLPEGSSSLVQDAIESHRHRPGALLPILHAIQERCGYIPHEAVPLIAASLQLTRAEVHGVISFYHDFRTTPPGRHIVQICRAEACQARGARALESHARQALGIDYHQTTASREITLEPVYCLGNCACGPSLRIGDRIVGRVTAARFDQLVDDMSTQVLEVS